MKPRSYFRRGWWYNDAPDGVPAHGFQDFRVLADRMDDDHREAVEDKAWEIYHTNHSLLWDRDRSTIFMLARERVYADG